MSEKHVVVYVTRKTKQKTWTIFEKKKKKTYLNKFCNKELSNDNTDWLV